MALRWPPEPLAQGGFDVVRLDAKTLLPFTLSEPPHRFVPLPSPPFPVLDPGAVRDPVPLLFYQVVGKSSGGVRAGI